MRPQQISEVIKANFRGPQVPMLITGPPGGGKTSVVRQTAADLSINYVEKHLPTMLVEDFGVPDMLHAKAGFFNYILPDGFPIKGSELDDGVGGIMCFDDRNQGGADLQKVLANIQEARNLHGHPLADNWMIISTGNRQTDGAGSNKVLTHLSDREMEIPFDTHLDDWTKYALDKDLRTEVIQFIRFRTALLHDFDPKRPKNATPRGWESVSNLLGVMPRECEYECFAGRVGEGAAAEFTGFMKIFRGLPNPDQVLMNPDTSDVPTDPATLYALSGAIAERATDTNFERVTHYSERMPAEFSVLTVSYAVRKKPELAETSAFTKWIVKHEEVLF